MPDPKITPECIVCHRPMHLLDEDEERWYCYRDDQTFLAKQNTWEPPIEQLAETKRLTEEKQARKNPLSSIVAVVFAILAVLELAPFLQTTRQIDGYLWLCGDSPISMCAPAIASLRTQQRDQAIFIVLTIVVGLSLWLVTRRAK